MEMQYLDDIGNLLEPLKLQSALESEIFKYNYRKEHMDKEIDEENKWKNEIVKKIAIIQSDMQEIVKEIKKSK